MCFPQEAHPDPPTMGVLANHTGELETEEEGGEVLAIACVIIFASFVINRWVAKYWAESVTTIVLGAVAGGILKAAWPSTMDRLRFDEETFILYILPPIIYDAGFSLRHHGAGLPPSQ